MSPLNKSSFNLKAMTLLACAWSRTGGVLVLAAIILISFAALPVRKAQNPGGQTAVSAFTAHADPVQNPATKKRPAEVNQPPSITSSKQLPKSDTEQKPVCPSMEMSCPESVVAGSEVHYTAEWKGGTPGVKPEYLWSVSAGKIIKGQGSRSMSLSTKGVQEKSLTVTLELVGFGTTCSKSCGFRVDQPDDGIVVPVTPTPVTPTPTPAMPTPTAATPTPTPATPTPTAVPLVSPSPSLISSPSPTSSASASPMPSPNVVSGVTPDASPSVSPQPSPSTTPPGNQGTTSNWPWILAGLAIAVSALWFALRGSVGNLFKGGATDLEVDPIEEGNVRKMEKTAVEKDLSALILGTKGKTDEDVRCTVFAPHEAAPGDAFLVQAFAHLAKQAPLLTEIAKQADRDTAKRGSKKLGAIAHGEKLGFYLEMPGLEIDDPSQSLDWLGEITSLEFGVSVPETFKSRSVNCKLSVSLYSVPIGHIKFNFKVSAATQTTPTDVHEDFVLYKLAFISYASADRREVMRRVQMLDVTKIRYFQDLLSLEAGKQWEPAIYRYIDECDVFYLFWSTAAKKSKWVKKEVQRALNRKGDNFDAPPEIIGVPIEGPPPVEPPRYLASIHFDSKFLYFINPRDGV